MPKIIIYTDGSANVKEGHPCYRLGGIGVVFTIDGEVKKKISKGYSSTKTGRMELMAVITALTILSKSMSAIIYSDSIYVVDCFKKNWLSNWERQLWPDRLKNIDLLKRLYEEHKKFKPGFIQFRHVKGHSGVEMNELADKLANYKQFKEYTHDSDEILKESVKIVPESLIIYRKDITTEGMVEEWLEKNPETVKRWKENKKKRSEPINKDKVDNLPF